MRNVSHISFKTPIRSLLEYLDAWREQQGWGRDKLAATIVDQYEATGGPARYKVKFEHCADVFKRAHTCATRIFRWFKDDDKDTNLLSVNFLMPILQSMPRSLAILWINEFLRPLHLAVHSLNNAGESQLDVQSELISLIKKGAESQQAFAALLSDQSIESIERALREMNDAIEAQNRIRTILLTVRNNNSPG